MQDKQEKKRKGITGQTFEELKALPPEEQKRIFSEIHKLRKKAKIRNFSCTYKVGAKTLSRNNNSSVTEEQAFIDAYWVRNKAILDVERALRTKTINGQEWLFNPVSKFWYSLRNEKDKFSTLNQGTAVYVFDIYGGFLRKSGIIIPFQYHDEFLFNVKKGEEEETKEKVQQAIRKVNEKLRLNVTVGCSIKFGENYAECH